MENNLQQITTLAEGNSTIVLCVADSCPHCVELKKHSDEISTLAQLNNLNVEFLHIENSENHEFFKMYPFETLPYALVFIDGEFKGGDETSKEMLDQLIPLLNRKQSA